jgi:hypothetical protein
LTQSAAGIDSPLLSLESRRSMTELQTRRRANGRDLIFERRKDAPAKRVFDAWTLCGEQLAALVEKPSA